MFDGLLRFNARVNNSSAFWWTLGAINATMFALHLTEGRVWHTIATLGLVGWSMYELHRIQKLNKENKNDN